MGVSILEGTVIDTNAMKFIHMNVSSMTFNEFVFNS